MYSKILSKIRTKQDVRLLEEELDLLIGKLYSAEKGVFEQTLEKKVRSWVSADLKEGLSKTAQRQEYLKGLLLELSKLKALSLTISFEPTEDGLDRLHSWVREHVGSGIILEINVEPSLLGGAKVIFEGRYLDSSLTARFKKVFSEEKEQFNQILSE